MAKRRYALERGGPKQLTLRWRWGLRDFEVSLGATSWKIDRHTLTTGANIVLPDGSSLLVKVVKPPWWSVGRRREVLVERDQIPLPGSDGHPRVIGRGAARLVLLFAIVRLLLVGVWTVFQRNASAASPLAGWFGIEAVVLVVLAIAAALGARLAVALAAGVFSIEIVALLASGVVLNPIGLLIQVLVIVHLVSSWRRMAPRQRAPSLASVFE